jgi:DNA-binding GntR family transcriptional regulator
VSASSNSRTSSRAAAAYNELRSAIVAGRLSGTGPLVERDLARSLEVSRTPIREALRRLELEGFIRRDESDRLVVHRPSSQELNDNFLVREMLEGYAAGLAAERISEDELDRLDTLIAADVEAAARNRIDDLAKLNDEIHELILVASRNRILVGITRELRDKSTNVFAVGGKERQKRFVDDHAAIVSMLRAGSRDGVVAVMRQHFHAARDLLLEALDTTTEPTKQ